MTDEKLSPYQNTEWVIFVFNYIRNITRYYTGTWVQDGFKINLNIHSFTHSHTQWINRWTAVYKSTCQFSGHGDK